MGTFVLDLLILCLQVNNDWFYEHVFSLWFWIKMTVQFWVISKMNESDKTNLTDQLKFRLNEIRKIENYFNSEISQRKLCSKKLSKYVTAFD